MAKNNSSVRKQATILGIYLDSTNTRSLLTKVDKSIGSGHKFYIVTPNPEIILRARTDEKLKKALINADIKIPDGVGLKIAAPSLRIIPGRQFMLSIFELANQKQWKIFLFGSTPLTIKRALARLNRVYPNLTVSGAPGPRYDNNADPVSEVDSKMELDTVNKIRKIKPHLLFVALGAPKQEKWIQKWHLVLPVMGMMAVGGSLDYFAGVKSTPPKSISRLGFEWLWRLREKGHYKRVFNATIVFPLWVLKEKLTR